MIKALKKIINTISLIISLPLLKYKKGNHEAAMGGVIAGLIFMAGTLVTFFDSSLKCLLGCDVKYLTDFLALVGLVALIGGIVEYRRLKKLYRQ